MIDKSISGIQRRKKKLNTIDAGSQVTSIIWSREYKELFSSHGFPRNHLSVWGYPSLNKVADMKGHDARVLHSALSPDGQTVVTGAADENLKFWKVFESKKGKKNGDGSNNVNAVKSTDDHLEDELVSVVKNLSIR